MNAKAEDNAKQLRAQYARLLAGREVNQAWADAWASTPAFWEQAWREGVGACVWHALQARGLGLDQSIQTQHVERVLRGQTAHALMLRQGAAEALDLLGRASIDVVMLRGQSIADVLYPRASLRPQTDIDLLIDGKDEARTASALADAGFHALPGHPMLFARGELLLDVHTEPLGIERIASWALLTPLRAGDFFCHADHGALLGVPAVLPHHRVTLPYLCFHAMKHSFEHMIWLWDIALLARRITQDQGWEELAAGIAEYALQRPCFYALSYADAHLAAEVPSGLLESLRPRMDWRERQLFSRFMQHEQIPFLAERLFARMQPDAMHRLAFWRETIWPRAEVRRQVDADPSSRGGFAGKRMLQIGRAAGLLVREMMAVFRAR